MALDNKQHYREFCDAGANIALFLQHWWLDAVAGENNWQVAIVSKGGEIQAALPYTLRHRAGLTFIGQPRLTQFLGPWLKQSEARYTRQLAQQKKMMLQLIDQLPTFGEYRQNWNPDVTNWLPFYWRGFSQTTRYTYVLSDIDDENAIWNGLETSARTDIRKAKERFGLQVEHRGDIRKFLTLNHLTFSRQGISAPYSDELLLRIDDACAMRHCRQMLFAVDNKGRAHAAIYLVWDKSTIYYLLGGSDPDLRNSGAISLCLWEGIRFASQRSKNFNFEGSMIENIERSFRAFGGSQVPYFNIRKTPSWAIRLMRLFRGI